MTTEPVSLPLGTSWMFTRKHFLDGRYRVDIQESLVRLAGELPPRKLSDLEGRYRTATLYALPDADGYAVVARNFPEDARQCALLEHVGDEWHRIGVLDSWGLYINEAHRGQGLGARLAYAGMVLCNEDTTDYALYSEAGYRAFSAAHKLAVAAALKAGAAVPQKVLEDYPDLSAARASSPRL
ncbi:hypothetical protein O9X98_14335 [Agrobacterium salinitolerans]|nr:hypothetical protein [Agrobacterium salinitolerans]